MAYFFNANCDVHPKWWCNNSKHHLKPILLADILLIIMKFSAIIIKGFGFTTVNSLLLISLAYILQLFLVLLATGGCSFVPNTRTYWMAWNFAIAITGAVLVRQLPGHMKWARLAGACMSGAYGANFPLIMSLVSGNVGGFTKKATVNSIVRIAAPFPKSSNKVELI